MRQQKDKILARKKAVIDIIENLLKGKGSEYTCANCGNVFTGLLPLLTIEIIIVIIVKTKGEEEILKSKKRWLVSF